MKRLEHVKDNREYRWRKPETGKYYYYIIKECVCGNRWLTYKYQPGTHCSNKCAGPRTGRPIGYRVSDKTRKKMSDTRKNVKQSIETRKKISKTLGGRPDLWEE